MFLAATVLPSDGLSSDHFFSIVKSGSCTLYKSWKYCLPTICSPLSFPIPPYM